MNVWIWRPHDEPRPAPIEIVIGVLPRVGETIVMPDTLKIHEVVEIHHHADLPEHPRPAMLTEITLAAARMS
jgi:hypothetical protein